MIYSQHRKEQYRIYHRTYYLKNREIIIEKAKQYQKEHGRKKQTLESRHTYYLKNKEKIRAYQKKYENEHKEQRRIYDKCKRERLKSIHPELRRSAMYKHREPLGNIYYD